MSILFSIMIMLGCEKDPTIITKTEFITETVTVEVPGPTVVVPGETQIVEVPGANVSVPYPPAEYEFTRNGVSTVYYSGQTTRLNQHDELKSAMNSTSSTKAGILAMLNDGTGFSDSTLDGSKKIGNKTAVNSANSATNKSIIESWITEFIDVVAPAVIAQTDASAGVAGSVSDAGGGSRTGTKVNAKGLEMNQVFSKGLIGAFNLDQIINENGSFGYVTGPKLNPVAVDNDAGVMHYTSPGASEANVTKMEHYWDEGFGYLYGQDNQYAPALGQGGLLNDYLGNVSANYAIGIADDIYNAFKLGRAAIVGKDYVTRDAQAAIIKTELSKVVGAKAASYLRSGAGHVTNNNMASAFHSLSEGYGFIFSLQFTQKADGSPYMTNSEVNSTLAELDAGNGLWDRTAAELTAMADSIDAATGINTNN
jgi:hypothetical protein